MAHIKYISILIGPKHIFDYYEYIINWLHRNIGFIHRNRTDCTD